MKKKICAGLVLFAAAGALVWWLAPAPAAQPLRDGSFIAVNSVSHGTYHPTRWGGVWRDYARKCLPARYADRITPSLQASRGFPTNGTVIWFRRWCPKGRDWPMPDVLAQYECVLLDTQGQVRAASPVVLANFTIRGFTTNWGATVRGETRMLGFAVFPPLTGRNTLRIQRIDEPVAATKTNVEFIVNGP